MSKIAENLKERSLRFALRVMKFCRTLPEDWEGRFIADQLFRAGSRTAANYRAACRAKSRRDFINKAGSVVEESDESVFWLTLIGRSGMSDTGTKVLASGGRSVAGDLHSVGKDRQLQQSSITQHSALCIQH